MFRRGRWHPEATYLEVFTEDVAQPVALPFRSELHNPLQARLSSQRAVSQLPSGSRSGEALPASASMLVWLVGVPGELEQGLLLAKPA